MSPIALDTDDTGQPIPADTPHAVSVSLPTWRANVGYEEGEQWVLSKMKNGYPRFYIHNSITAFAEDIVKKHGCIGEQAVLFPSAAIAARCVEFFLRQAPHLEQRRSIRVLHISSQHGVGNGKFSMSANAHVSAVIFPQDQAWIAKVFWQHTGDGVSSRRAEFCHRLFEEGCLFPNDAVMDQLKEAHRFCKGPRRYQRPKGSDEGHLVKVPAQQFNDQISAEDTVTVEKQDTTQFVEERFGRNLDPLYAENAKIAIRRRIAGSLTANTALDDAIATEDDTSDIRKVQGFSLVDVYLYPTGMSSIFNIHRTLLSARGNLKSICFGFPYIDTLKILEKWGPGCLFYGNGSSHDLDDLESRCQRGERFLALFCEFPGNPLLKTPDICRIRFIADTYDFAVVIDETVGNFMNVHVLPYADAVVSSLTKVFSGDSNVMGGSAVLNPKGVYYRSIIETLKQDYEDNYWPEDAIFMERNSRDFVSRIERINSNAEAICEVLKDSPRIKALHYPKYSPTRPNYEHCRNPKGGYGGLLSVTFHSAADAIIFFDTLETAKGPSLGTNFTLCSPYTLLAHYGELEWAAHFGVDANLVRASVGLEDAPELARIFQHALDSIKPTHEYS